MSKQITVTLDDEIYDKALNLVHVVNYLARNKGDEITLEDLTLTTLKHYVTRYYDNMILNASTLDELIPLGNPGLPLRFNIEEHVQKLGLPLLHVAKQLKISKGTLVGIIENKHQPSLDIFIRLWVLIGCPPLHEILYRENTDNKGE